LQQVIPGGTYDNVSNSATEMTFAYGGRTWIANGDYARMQLISAPGKLKSLIVKLENAPGVGNSVTLTIRINQANTLLAVTVSGTDTTGSNKTNEITVSPGDQLSISATPASTPTVGYAKWSFIFEGDNKKESILPGGINDTLSTTLTEYNVWAGHESNNAAATIWAQRIPTSGKIKDFYCETQNAPGGSEDYTMTLMLNGAPSALEVAISGASTTGSDLVNEITVSKGDSVELRVVPSVGGPAAGGRLRWCSTFVADIDGESIVLASANRNLDAGATEFIQPNNQCDGPGTKVEADCDHLYNACTLKKFFVQIRGTPGAGNSYTFNHRIDGGDSTLEVVISDSETFDDSGGIELEVTEGQVGCIEITPASTPTVRGMYGCGFVCFIAAGENSTLFLKLGLGGYGNQGGRIPHIDNGLGLKRHPRSRAH